MNHEGATPQAPLVGKTTIDIGQTKRLTIDATSAAGVEYVLDFYCVVIFVGLSLNLWRDEYTKTDV